jgi:TonB family protein
MSSERSFSEMFPILKSAFFVRYGLIKLVVLAAFATDAIATSSVLQKETPTAEQHIEKARDAIQRKKYGDGEKELKRALKLKQNSPEANLLMGLVRRRRGDYKDAVEYIQKALKYREKFPDAHYLLALVHYEKNELLASAMEVEKTIEQGGRFANLYMLKGNLELADRKYESAITSYEEALRLARPDEEILPRLREIAGGLKRYREFRILNSDFSAWQDHPGYKRPVPVNRPRPNYTESARYNKIQGVIRVVVEVDEQGKLGAILIIKGIGYGLDEEAVKAVRMLKFKPALIAGKPAAFWVPIDVEFNLK